VHFEKHRKEEGDADGLRACASYSVEHFLERPIRGASDAASALGLVEVGLGRLEHGDALLDRRRNGLRTESLAGR